MSAAHTPGPWAEFEPTDTLHAVRSVLGKIVADVGYSGTIEGDKANARLIAAAPDLLEALCIAKKFMEIASDWSVDEAEINGDMRSTYDWLEIVNSAIAKATGGQS